MELGIFIDPSSLPAGVLGFFQVASLGAVYFYVLSIASNLMADGSELLLLLPRWEKLVGSVVLPVLGAVPDGAIVLFSGLGGNVEEEIAVGVGTLTGSTVMLITVPYAMSIVNGLVPRLKSDPRKPDYERNNELNGVIASGSPTIKRCGVFVGLTLIAYMIVQFPSTIISLSNTVGVDNSTSGMSKYILLSALFCLLGLIYYIYDCYVETKTSAQRKVAASKRLRRTIALLKDGAISINDVLELAEAELWCVDVSGDLWKHIFSKPLIPNDYDTFESDSIKTFERKIQEILKPIFDDLDHDHNGSICYQEAYHLLVLLQGFKSSNSSMSTGMLTSTGVNERDRVKAVFDSYDKDHSGNLDLTEFCDLVWKGFHHSKQSRDALLNLNVNSVEKQVGDSDSFMDPVPTNTKGGRSMSSVPGASFQSVSATEKEASIFREAVTTLGIGTFLVLLFSNPMVDIINEMGRRTGIPAFYLAFIFAPLASNSAEAVASTKIAESKTPNSLSVALSALLGAAIMNNTFCLFVFLILIYYHNLTWNFGAEVGGVLFAQCVMVFYSQNKTYNYKDAMVIASVYPVSLAGVAVLKLFLA